MRHVVGLYTLALAGSLSLVSEWSKVTLDFHNFSVYSSWSQQCCSLDGFDSPNDFQFLKSLLGDPGNRPGLIDYNWNYFFLHVPELFEFSCNVQVFLYILFSFIFRLVVHRNRNIHKMANFFFLLINTRSGLLAWLRWCVCISKSHRILWVFITRTDSGLCIYHLVEWF